MERTKVQVIGGGFSGLAAAYFLSRAGKKVHLVEESDEWGGILQTIHTPFGLVETAANAMLSNKLVEETAEELGLPLTRTLPSAKKRFIYRGRSMRRWPLSGAASLRFFSETLPKFLLARASFKPKPQENLRAWGYRCLGEEATEYLLIPALSGVYAGQAENLSATLILKNFFGAKKIPKGKLRGSVAPLPGMGAWSKGFRWYLEKRITFSKVPKENIPTVVALPPHRAAAFLQNRAPRLAADLQKIEMLPLLSVTVFYPMEAASIPGFGCLFPRIQGFRVLGILANGQIFPERTNNTISETWIFGGATDKDILGLSDEEILLLIQKERQQIFGEFAPFLHHSIHRWPRAIPHYNLELENTLSSLVREGDYIPFGTYMGDLGLARVLVRAQELAKQI